MFISMKVIELFIKQQMYFCFAPEVAIKLLGEADVSGGF